MVLKSLGLAVTVASRDLFLAPAGTNEAAFTVLDGPALVPANSAVPMPAYVLPAQPAAQEDSSLAWAGAFAAAGLVGMAISTATSTQRSRSTPADELNSAMLEHELSAQAGKLAMFATGGQEVATPVSSAAWQRGENEIVAYAKTLPGVSQPFGFWDPIGICSGNAGLDSGTLTKERIDFYREAELKHGRVGMVATLGFFVQEGMGYHPLLNNNSSGIDALSDPALTKFWPFGFALVGLFEAAHAAIDFDKPVENPLNPIWSADWTLKKHKWTLKKDKVYGRYGSLIFDPLRLAPKDPQALKDMQTREINNGRLGMLAAAGIIAQETVTGKGFTELEASGPTIAGFAGGIGLIWAATLAIWDFADDKNAGFQGKDQGGAADRWKFGADRYDTYEYGASEAVLTGVAPPPAPRAAFDGKAYAETLPGIYATVAPGVKGMWDPLGFTSKPDITKAKVDFYRDAETKHGRLGMLATVGMLGSEASHPVAGSAADGVPAIWMMGKVPQPGWFWIAFVIACGVAEGQSMRGDGQAERDIWDPGNFAKDGETLVQNKNTELAFGRIGMIAAFGMIIEELSTGKPMLS
jgi:hypothetical protein